ncbi:alpha/beta hydrolase [Alisedimentitalea sp. MJ-SS2]|uniref:alpha/beta fold hydrolase n=1 Tax=Aliisedimentitalea sp. MJ-SS2 TaxID=3049795 RepID=UPI002907ED29|nr:alpha/beta hydrolase [Alisedimentitalea sp. MJ-SS2]MDU8929390.1 alpha/beta hydrolase [Alisedimentitalea sp. MJ-SS2]
MPGAWLVGGIALAGAAPWLGELLRKPVRRCRAEAPGAFLDLPDGKVHCRWQGPEQGPVAVLVHGLTTPEFVWDEVAKRLVSEGWRVLSYDLYGRGYSDRPHGPQDVAFFIRQLKGVLQDQGVADGFTLVGYSMGGAISAGYAAAFPGRMERVVLLAPAGMGHELGTAAALSRLPLPLAEWLMLLLFPRKFRQAITAEIAAEQGQPGVPEAITSGQRAQLERRGYVRSVLASLRGMLTQDFEPFHRALAEAKVPVTAIWGAEDETIPIAAKDVLAGWNPQTHHVVIDGAGHGLAYTHADQVVRAFLEG